MAGKEKLVVIATHGPDEPELATLPFVMAAAAATLDVEVVMGFQADGVRLVRQGVAETVSSPEFTPLFELLKTLQESGAKLLVGAPCIKSRNIAPEELVGGTEVVMAGRFVSEIVSATSSLVY